MRTITITGKDRPELFRNLLQSLAMNDLDGWRVLVAIEPGPRATEFAPLAAELLAGVDHAVAVNDTVLGIRENPFRLIQRAFAEGSRLNLYLEEDMLVSPDVTRIARWFEAEHRAGWLCANLMAAPCGSTAILSAPQWPDIFFESTTFNALGFIVRRQEWHEAIAPVWMGAEPGTPLRSGHAGWRRDWGWDWSVYALVAGSTRLRTVQPVFARATHTGRVGMYAREAFHDAAFGGMRFNQSQDIVFRLVGRADLPHEIRSHLNAHDEMTKMRLELEDLATRLRFKGRVRAWFARRKRRLLHKLRRAFG